MYHFFSKSKIWFAWILRWNAYTTPIHVNIPEKENNWNLEIQDCLMCESKFTNISKNSITNFMKLKTELNNFYAKKGKKYNLVLN